MKVLVVEDNPSDVYLMQEIIAQPSRIIGRDSFILDLQFVGTLSEAISELKQGDYDLALLDLNLPDSTGIKTFETLHAEDKSLPIIILTGDIDANRWSSALGKGAQDYLVKGEYNRDLLMHTITYSIERQKLRNELEKNMQELTQVKKELEERGKKLEESNKELESFAYIASHDLNEPLRKVIAFGDRLKAKCYEDLSDKGRDYMDRMQGATKRMQVLLNDLLQYSRVDSAGGDFQLVDLNDVMDEVSSDLEERILETDCKIDCDNLPIIEADKTQMRELFQNLISNSIKFRKEGEKPFIRISAKNMGLEWTNADKQWEIDFQDNGIGFDQEYSSKIFQQFKRLHGREAYEGTGMGLAICKKIAQRHGGDINAFSKLGAGCNFKLQIPGKHV